MAGIVNGQGHDPNWIWIWIYPVLDPIIYHSGFAQSWRRWVCTVLEKRGAGLDPRTVTCTESVERQNPKA